MTEQWQAMAAKGRKGTPLMLRPYPAASGAKGGPLVLYLGGGAFLDKGLEEAERPVARALADAGAVVLEADYATPSDNSFPEALNVAFEALQHLSAKRRQWSGAKSLLFVAGEEAGGNVAAGVALKARDQMPGELAGQALFSPMIDPRMISHSIRRASEIGMLDRWSDGWRHYLRQACGLQHPYAAPCLCSRLSGIAPALILTSEDDPLKDETVGYGARLQASGVAVSQTIFPAALGWTGIYREKTGHWLEALTQQFFGFADALQTGAACGRRMAGSSAT